LHQAKETVNPLRRGAPTAPTQRHQKGQGENEADQRRDHDELDGRDHLANFEHTRPVPGRDQRGASKPAEKGV
jgi:hypothetical protein